MVNRIIIDGEAGDSPHGSRSDVEHADTLPVKRFHEFNWTARGRIDIEVHDVRLDTIQIYGESGAFIDGTCKSSSTSMVISKSIHMVIQCIYARCSKQPRLSHYSAIHLPIAVYAGHRGGISCNDRTDRSAQPLRKADGDRIEVCGDVPRSLPRCHGSVPQACSIKVAAKPM